MRDGLTRSSRDLEGTLGVSRKDPGREARREVAESGEPRIVACGAAALEAEHRPSPKSIPAYRRHAYTEWADEEAVAIVGGKEGHQARALPARTRILGNGGHAGADTRSPARRRLHQPLLLQRLVLQRLLRAAESRRQDEGDRQQNRGRPVGPRDRG